MAFVPPFVRLYVLRSVLGGWQKELRGVAGVIVLVYLLEAVLAHIVNRGHARIIDVFGHASRLRLG